MDRVKGAEEGASIGFMSGVSLMPATLRVWFFVRKGADGFTSKKYSDVVLRPGPFAATL